jgi:GNAT superfamily N-acetyltransferase
MRRFYELTYWQFPGARRQAGPGYQLGYTGYPDMATANLLWLEEAAALNARTLDAAARFFRPFGAEWRALVLPKAQPRLKATCIQQGGAITATHPLMMLQGPPNLAYPPPPLHIEAVRGAVGRYLAQQILAEAFQLSADPQQSLFQAGHEGQAEIEHYLAYVEGHPAACATLVYHGGLAGVWNIGVRRDFRGRGVASALMAWLCGRLSEGGHPQNFLLASLAGFRLYQSLGYRLIGRAHYFALPYL